MIRSQQLQLQQMQQQQQQHHQQQQPLHQHVQQQQHQSGTAIIDDWTPTSERSVSYSPVQPLHNPARSTIDPAHGSYNSEWSILTGSEVGARRSSRDESAFYQAEAAMLSRENQMLRLRIRDLGTSLLAFA
jgi:hypothetical protein